MERWVEHYLALYATQKVVSDTPLKAILVLDELHAAELTVEELSKAIDFLSTDKAPGDSDIPLRNHEEWDRHLAAGLARDALSVLEGGHGRKTCAMPR